MRGSIRSHWRGRWGNRSSSSLADFLAVDDDQILLLFRFFDRADRLVVASETLAVVGYYVEIEELAEQLETVVWLFGAPALANASPAARTNVVLTTLSNAIRPTVKHYNPASR